MNPDHPDLTTYALGELPPGQEREMRAWIASNPEAQAELAGIEQISDSLHHGAPVPVEKLTVQQRQAVLTPPKGPRIHTPMMPRQPLVRRQPGFAPFFAGVMKIAAVLAVGGAAFLLGRHSGGPAHTDIARTGMDAQGALTPSARPMVPLKSTPVKTAPVVAEVVPAAPVAPAPAPKPAAAPVVTTPAATPVVAKVAAASEAPKPAAAATPAPVPAPSPAVAATAGSASADARGYTAVSREPVARITIRPHETRPAPVKIKGDALASPPAKVPPPPPPAANEKTRSPDLAIQSWKTEVATCPWNPAHRLMRVVLQLPADQPASTSPANAYGVQVSFDKLAVRGYRLLSQTHVAPQAGSSTAAHVAWYEIVPNGGTADTNREAGRIVATITVPGARFNSQTVGPFDSSKLLALDRGSKWENAREDFLFETSIVGFGLLLRGEENLGTLNHELVLKLARQAQGDKELDGERAKFIRLVQEAKRMTGI